MRCTRIRKKVSPSCATVHVSEELSRTRLPTEGVPEQVRECAVRMEEAEQVRMQLDGPATRRAASFVKEYTRPRS